MIIRLSLAARIASLSVYCLALASCDTSNAIIPDTSSTTVPPIPVAYIPDEITCPLDDIRRDTGDVYEGGLLCVPGWAVGLPKKITDTLDGDSEVEGEWILKLTKSGWKTVGVCNIYHLIYPSGETCNAIGGADVDTSMLPPLNIQCALWHAASWDDNIKETGCPASAD